MGKYRVRIGARGLFALIGLRGSGFGTYLRGALHTCDRHSDSLLLFSLRASPTRNEGSAAYVRSFWDLSS